MRIAFSSISEAASRLGGGLRRPPRAKSDRIAEAGVPCGTPPFFLAAAAASGRGLQASLDLRPAAPAVCRLSLPSDLRAPYPVTIVAALCHAETALAAALLIATGVEPQARSSPADADPRFSTGSRAAGGGDLEAAASEYQQFLASQPRNIEALSNLGVTYARLGRYDDAITAYRKALEFAPHNASIRMNVALAFYKSGRCPEAMSEFDTVSREQPGASERASSEGGLSRPDGRIQAGR